MPDPTSGADLLARIQPKLREDSVFICLRPDLVEEWERLNEQLQEQYAEDRVASAQRLAARPKGAEDEQAVLAARIQELEQQTIEASAEFRFRALTKDQWRNLCDAHPPRPKDEIDQMIGYNRIGVLDAAVRACMIDPVFDDESWAQFVDVVSEGEFAELRRVVNAINTGVVDNPKSVLASRILSRHAATSAQPEAGESAPAGSTAGNPEKSTNTTAPTE